MVCWSTQFYSFWTKHKAVLWILSWQMVNSLMYHLTLDPSFILTVTNSTIASVILTIEATIAILSPIAGYVADMKYGQYKVLKVSTQFMIAFKFFILLFWILISSIANTTEYKLYLLFSGLLISIVGYLVGRVLFITNIVQFGIEQLRDDPTFKSDFYLVMVLFADQLTELVIKTCKSQFNFRWKLQNNIISISNESIIAFDVCFSVSIVISVIILFLVEKYSSKFEHHNTKGNPYKLVYGVMSFAIKHKKPIRRSAFTFCDDERPSRLDFGKQRYGGPFTTEQVEDVKVMINIVKVLIAVSPYFLLEFTGNTVLDQYRLHKELYNSNFLHRMILENATLSPFIVTIFILFFFIIIRSFNCNYTVSILKRIGASLIIGIFMQLIMIVCGIISRDKHYSLRDSCLIVNISSIDNLNVPLPELLLPTLSQVCLAFSQMLFYIAVWQFICCQSPRYMKGLLFGLYYFSRAVLRLISIILLHFSFSKNFKFGCAFNYLIIYFVIGVITLILFMITAHRYRYRKREDICNVYQYAEDYYAFHE